MSVYLRWLRTGSKRHTPTHKVTAPEKQLLYVNTTKKKKRKKEKMAELAAAHERYVFSVQSECIHIIWIV